MTDAEPGSPTGASSPCGSHQVTLAGVSQRFLTVDGISTEALGPIDLDIDDGSFVALVGPSGCGKSTLLRLIAGFAAPAEGTVRLDGALITGPGPERGVVFQQPNLYPWLSVAGNVEFGLRMRRIPRARRAKLVAEHLELVGLSDFARHRPYELSGGMQQRAQLARVLANEPSIVLMDEPFGALDAQTRERLQDELLRIWRASRTTVLFITHSVDEAIYLGTRVLVMSPRPGTIVADLPAPFSSSASGGPSDMTPGRGGDVRRDRQFADLARRVATCLHGVAAE